MATNLSLETPEQTELNYTIARLGSRFIAALWDSLAIVLLQVMLFGVGLVLIEGLGLGGEVFSNWAWAVVVLLSFLLLWGYYVIFELIWNGQSPGKRLAGIRAVRSDGYPLGFSESAIRNLVRIADFLPGLYGLGMLVMFIDDRSRRLGDFAASTLVVHERPAPKLSTLRQTAVEDERLLLPALPNLERLRAEEVEAARRFLQRRADLVNQVALEGHLASRLRDQLQLPPDIQLSDLELIRRVVAQHGRQPIGAGPGDGTGSPG